MSICCAFSFSWIFHLYYFPPLVLFFAGMGWAKRVLLQWLLLEAFSRRVGVLLLVQFLSVRRSVRTQCWRWPRRCHSGCFASSPVFSPHIGSAWPAPVQLCCSTCTRRTRALILEELCVSVCECVCARMWLELFSYFSEFQGRKRRGILHHFSKDLWQDFGCGSPLPSPLICPMERSLLLSFTYIITSRNVEKERWWNCLCVCFGLSYRARRPGNSLTLHLAQ